MAHWPSYSRLISSSYFVSKELTGGGYVLFQTHGLERRPQACQRRPQACQRSLKGIGGLSLRWADRAHVRFKTHSEECRQRRKPTSRPLPSSMPCRASPIKHAMPNTSSMPKRRSGVPKRRSGVPKQISGRSNERKRSAMPSGSTRATATLATCVPIGGCVCGCVLACVCVCMCESVCGCWCGCACVRV